MVTPALCEMWQQDSYLWDEVTLDSPRKNFFGKHYFLEITWIVTLRSLVYQTPKDGGLSLLILCAP